MNFDVIQATSGNDACSAIYQRDLYLIFLVSASDFFGCLIIHTTGFMLLSIYHRFLVFNFQNKESFMKHQVLLLE